MIIKDTCIKEPILQNLIPVLTEDGVLRGIIQTSVNEWSGDKATLEFPNRTINLTAKNFCNECVTRELMCAVFPVTLSPRNVPWNGIPGFISADRMGYFSIWAIPVLNPGYNRNAIGELEIFVSNKLDPKSLSAPTLSTSESASEQKTIIVSIRIGVSVYKFSKKFSFVEFNWADVFRKKLESMGIEEQCFLSVQVVQSPASFKSICYNSTNSSSIPYILQIMRISRDVPDVGTYEFVLDIVGKNHYLFQITLNVKS